MILKIQRYLEDTVRSLGLDDTDGYASALAGAYATVGSGGETAFLRSATRVRTVLFRNRRDIRRSDIEKDLYRRLRARFGTNPFTPVHQVLGNLEVARRAFNRKPRRSIAAFLDEFRRHMEARGVNLLWESRTAGRMHRRPEKIAQEVFAVYCRGVLGSSGQILREIASGAGFVDSAVMFAKTPHLVELKILRSGLAGPSQLQTYMAHEDRSVGWLLVFDARPPRSKQPVPRTIRKGSRKISVVVVDVNPVVPSRL